MKEENRGSFSSIRELRKSTCFVLRTPLGPPSNHLKFNLACLYQLFSQMELLCIKTEQNFGFCSVLNKVLRPPDRNWPGCVCILSSPMSFSLNNKQFAPTRATRAINSFEKFLFPMVFNGKCVILSFSLSFDVFYLENFTGRRSRAYKDLEKVRKK